MKDSAWAFWMSFNGPGSQQAAPFSQDGGTFDNQGFLLFDSDTLNCNGGNFTGNSIDLHNSILNNNTTGTGVFNLTGTCCEPVQSLAVKTVLEWVGCACCLSDCLFLL